VVGLGGWYIWLVELVAVMREGDLKDSRCEYGGECYVSMNRTQYPLQYLYHREHEYCGVTTLGVVRILS
jgi:hypothetical protein